MKKQSRILLLWSSIRIPQGWAYSDAQVCCAEMLKKPNNIPVILKDDGRNVGFLLAIPQDDAVEELESDDPLHGA